MDQAISAVILAGGQGRRFNYQDKGLIQWHGKPLISHVIEHIADQVDQIIINCNRNLEDYATWGYALCQDTLPDYQGPLAGIQSALAQIQHPFCLICACDTPNLPDNLARTLLTQLIATQSDVAYPQFQDRLHYLPVLMRSDLSSQLNEYLTHNDRSMKGWYGTLNAIAVPFQTAQDAFLNINTPALMNPD